MTMSAVLLIAAAVVMRACGLHPTQSFLRCGYQLDQRPARTMMLVKELSNSSSCGDASALQAQWSLSCPEPGSDLVGSGSEVNWAGIQADCKTISGRVAHIADFTHTFLCQRIEAYKDDRNESAKAALIEAISHISRRTNLVLSMIDRLRDRYEDLRQRNVEARIPIEQALKAAELTESQKAEIRNRSPFGWVLGNTSNTVKSHLEQWEAYEKLESKATSQLRRMDEELTVFNAGIEQLDHLEKGGNAWDKQLRNITAALS